MCPSYETINYDLRPAKHIERRMFVEAFQRLFPFGAVDSYRYVGFGSTYFSDFRLFHKALGITNMISIERDKNKRARFEFNLPFGCIEVIFGESETVLATLSWDIRTFFWLDYDKELTQSCLEDISLIASQCAMGSILIVSVPAIPPKFPFNNLPEEQVREEMARQIDGMRERLGTENVPSTVSPTDVRGWGTARLYRQIIQNRIEETIRDRNGIRPHGARIQYKQLFNFHYQDGVKMLTTGGLFYEEGDSGKVGQTMIEDLEFIRTDDNPYLIRVPKLTYRELRHLDSQLPTDDCDQLHAPGIPNKDIETYSRIYRYFPTFADADV